MATNGGLQFAPEWKRAKKSLLRIPSPVAQGGIDQWKLRHPISQHLSKLPPHKRPKDEGTLAFDIVPKQ